MSEVSERQDEPGGPGTHPRISGPHNIRNQHERFDAAGEVAAADAASAHHPPEYAAGLSQRIVLSGDGLRRLIDELRNRGVPAPAELRPLAEGFRRHCKATDETARQALEKRGPRIAAVMHHDRDEAEQLIGMLDSVIAGAAPEGTYALTAGGVIADIDQHLVHEQRDLIPLIDRELPLGESEHLAAAFRG